MNEQTFTGEQTQQVAAQFLIADLDLANNRVISVYGDYEIACRAYDNVARYLMRTPITRAEHELIVERMRALAERLREFEQRAAS